MRADVFFALEELNDFEEPFTKGDLLAWLNDEMEAVLTAGEVETVLEQMALSKSLRAGKNFR